MKIALVTLARKNSKRIPNKNFKLFCGKPLIHYTLEIMKELGFASYIMTDHEDIKEYAKNYDVTIIDMPKVYSEDKHQLMESLNYIDVKAQADVYVLLQPTSPIREAELIKVWIKHFCNHIFDSGYSVYRIPRKYYYIEGKPLNFNQSERDGNGSEKKDIYMENGSFYIFRRRILEEKHVIAGNSIQFFDKYGIDIDEPFQWQPFEKMFENIRRANENKNNT